jgi:1-deoxy-D-xylulose-5-phosphate synthase
MPGLRKIFIQLLNEHVLAEHDHGFFPKVTRMGLPDYFVEHGTVEQLRQIVGIDRDAIVSQLRSISQK